MIVTKQLLEKQKKAMIQVKQKQNSVCSEFTSLFLLFMKAFSLENVKAHIASL